MLLIIEIKGKFSVRLMVRHLDYGRRVKEKSTTKHDCSWERPLENLFNIEGPSHELMATGINYMGSLKPFGINEYVKEQGFVSEAAQESVMKGKFLRCLLENLIPFTEGA